MTHKIVFLERDSICVAARRPSFAHDWAEYPYSTANEIVPRLQGATIAITNKVRITAEVLAQLPDLKMVAQAATGTDNVDLDYCRAHGIVVSNIRGYAVNTVPEHAMMLMLALRRQLLAYRADVQTGRWQKAPLFCFFDHPIRELHGATLGIFGRGSLGQGVARLAEAFGMKVLWGERKGAGKAGAPPVREGYVPFERIVAEADVISLHCPLTEQTRGMFGAAELKAMKREAVLINTGRGGLVDEAALVRALKEGWIAGAGFDVLTKEPPSEGNPLLDPELLALPNFLLTPHVASASNGAARTLADQLIDNIEAFVAGQPRNRVA